MNAIILASGKGTRMLPWTNNKNKCMFKVNGKPLLQYHIEQLRRIGVENIIVTVHHKQETIIPFINDNNDIGFHIEKELKGSGTAISEIMEQYEFDQTIVIYGDTWFQPIFYDMIEVAYQKNENLIFLDTRQNYSNGLVVFDQFKNQINKICENGKIPNLTKYESIGKNLGILIFNRFIKEKGDLMKDVLPHFSDLFCYRSSNFDWCDIGEIERYIRLILEQYDSIAVQSLIKNLPTCFIEFAKKILLGERIFIAGNGGSLSTAQHLALDWSKIGGKNAIALGEASMLTAYSNDDGYENVFINQLKCFNITEKDVIVLISGSGNSKNIVKVLEAYPNNTICMSGPKGYLIANCKLTLPVQSLNIRVIEDIHLAYGHAITEIMEGLR